MIDWRMALSVAAGILIENFLNGFVGALARDFIAGWRAGRRDFGRRP